VVFLKKGQREPNRSFVNSLLMFKDNRKIASDGDVWMADMDILARWNW
jgi:hypothetical protein